ncbi:MAG: alpha/beta hydrolase family protein [Candidatus Hodarchaeales archaeon]
MTNLLQNKSYKPTIKDMLLLPLLGAAEASPDGTKVAYRKGSANFKDNRIDSYCYIYDVEKAESYPLTRTGQAFKMRWVTDKTLALMKKDYDNENAGFQLFIFENLIGEGLQVTEHEGGIGDFEPFAEGFVYIANNSEKDEKAKRKAKFGKFTQAEEEKSASSLYYVDSAKFIKEKQLSEKSAGENQKPGVKSVFELGKLLPGPVKIESVIPSPKGDAVFLNCRSKDDLFFEHETAWFRIQFNPKDIFGESNNKTPVVTQIVLPKGAKIDTISPDGSKLLVRHKGRDTRGYTQADLWILDLSETETILDNPKLRDHLVCITQNLDREPFTFVYWTKAGIFLAYWNESQAVVAQISETGEVEPIDLQGVMPTWFFHVSDAGSVCFAGSSSTTVAECYLSKLAPTGRELLSITNNNSQVTDWDLGTVESIRWISKDGTEIEGILRKPSNFDPNRKYPLLFNVHGGPHATSANILIEAMDKFYYPLVQFSHKDILVLKPNYRGSVGRGQAFKELLVDNVGVGDLWDLESAIDHLVSLGFVDEAKIATCGGSQGAYISAFAALHSDRFCAASGCATLASWYTYWSGSDLRYEIPFSGDQPYRNGGPFEERMKEIYEKTAPISGIDQAKTPLLLQHGENDERVPVYSSKELYRALKEKGVQTELFVYPGMGGFSTISWGKNSISLKTMKVNDHKLPHAEAVMFSASMKPTRNESDLCGQENRYPGRDQLYLDCQILRAASPKVSSEAAGLSLSRNCYLQP